MTAKKPNVKRDLALLISVPLLLAVILAAVVYLPRVFAKPAHDFIYAACASYRCEQQVTVQGEALHISNQQTDLYKKLQNGESVELYYYDVSNQSSRPVTEEEARMYRLDNSSRSPDGYVLTRQSSSSRFLFWDSGTSNWVLKNGLLKKTVDLGDREYYYDNSITFVGWVK